LVIRTVAEEALPIGVLFLDRRHEIRPTPASGLVHVPRHFSGDDGAEFPALEICASCHVGLARAALRADLQNPVGKSDDADADALVRTSDTGLGAGG
jgi:hypothetical protein